MTEDVIAAVPQFPSAGHRYALLAHTNTKTLMVHANAVAVKMSDRVSNTVYVARTKAGFTQEELADKVGVSRQTIIAIEKGNYTPSVMLALKIARAFKLCVDDLFHI